MMTRSDSPFPRGGGWPIQPNSHCFTQDHVIEQASPLGLLPWSAVHDDRIRHSRCDRAA